MPGWLYWSGNIFLSRLEMTVEIEIYLSGACSRITVYPICNHSVRTKWSSWQHFRQRAAVATRPSGLATTPPPLSSPPTQASGTWWGDHPQYLHSLDVQDSKEAFTCLKISQSVTQSMNQSINQSVSQFVKQSVRQTESTLHNFTESIKTFHVHIRWVSQHNFRSEAFV